MQETWVWSLGWGDPWRRERQPTPVFWPGEFHGLYSPWGCKESDTNEWLFSPSCLMVWGCQTLQGDPVVQGTLKCNSTRIQVCLFFLTILDFPKGKLPLEPYCQWAITLRSRLITGKGPGPGVRYLYACSNSAMATFWDKSLKSVSHFLLLKMRIRAPNISPPGAITRIKLIWLCFEYERRKLWRKEGMEGQRKGGKEE